MKNTRYIILALLIVSLFVVACGNKENHNSENGHSHSDDAKPAAKEEHSEEEAEET